MASLNAYRFGTQVVHTGQSPESWEGAPSPHIPNRIPLSSDMNLTGYAGPLFFPGRIQIKGKLTKLTA